MKSRFFSVTIILCGMFFAGAVMAQTPLRVVPFRIAVDSSQKGEGVYRALDGNPDTIWHTEYHPENAKMPHWILCDFGEPVEVTGVKFLARPGAKSGTVKDYAVFLGDDLAPILTAGESLRNAEKSLTAEDALNLEQKEKPYVTGTLGEVPDGWVHHVNFPAKKMRYLKFMILSNHQYNAFVAMAKFSVKLADSEAAAFALDGWDPREDEPFPKMDAYVGPVRVTAVTSETYGQEAWRALDGDPETVWRTRWSHRHDAHREGPHEFTLDLGERVALTGFTLTPPRGGGNGTPEEWEIYVGNEDGRADQFALRGKFEAEDFGPDQKPKTVSFEKLISTRYLRFRIPKTRFSQPWACVAEFQLHGISPNVRFLAAEYDAPKNETLRQVAKNGRWEPCDNWRCLLDLTLRTLDYVRDAKPQPGIFQELENRVWQLEAKLGAAGNPDDFKDEIRALRREIILSHPALDFEKMLVTKRPPPRYAHMCDQNLGRHNGVGAGLVLLENWKSREHVRTREILKDKLPPGTVLNPCLHWDGTRVLFGFCDQTPENQDLRCFHIWEAATDGSWVRQITGTPRDPMAGWDGRKTALIEDFDPCYLPDGGIAFISTRNQTFGRCHGGRYTPAYLLFRCDADGGNIRQLSFGEANEWTPSVLANGRLIYTRWDYINRHDTVLQGLWQMQPDGTGTAHYYGTNSRTPCMSVAAIQVPGSRKVASIGMAHHDYSFGTLDMLDTMEGEDGMAPVTRVTPEISYPEAGDPVGGGRDGGYATPFPLNETLFFAANYEYKRNGGTRGWRPDPPESFVIYLVDTLGGREKIYEDPEMSSFSPMPLIRRETPPVLVSRIDGTQNVNEMENPTGIFYVQDVFQSRQPLERGEGKWLRINRIYGQPRPSRDKSSVVDNEIVKGTLGVVPVGPDGKVAFEAPAGVPLQFQLLDENEMAIFTMRSTVYLQPGEVAGCVGCHEQRETTLAAKAYSQPTGLRDIRKIQPSPSQDYPGGFSFTRSVQPVLDRHCISCHGLDGRKDGNMDLTGVRDEQFFNRAYQQLTEPWGLVIRANRNGETDVSVPKDYFAHAGRLMSYLNNEHVKHWQPEPEAMKRLANWQDLNAQFYGDYSENRPERWDFQTRHEEALRTAIREEIGGGEGEKLARQPLETLVNLGDWRQSRVLMAPLAESAGGWGQIGKWHSREDAGFRRVSDCVQAVMPHVGAFDVHGISSRHYDHDWIRQQIDAVHHPEVDRGWEKMPNTQPENRADDLRDLRAEDADTPWRILRVSSEETVQYDFPAKNAIDGNEDTFWVTAIRNTPQKETRHELAVDFGKTLEIGGVRYLPLPHFGNLKDCEIFVTDTPDAPGEPVLRGFFDSEHDWQAAVFPEVKRGRYLILRIHSSKNNTEFAAMRELRLLVPREK